MYLASVTYLKIPQSHKKKFTKYASLSYLAITYKPKAPYPKLKLSRRPKVKNKTKCWMVYCLGVHGLQKKRVLLAPVIPNLHSEIENKINILE